MQSQLPETAQGYFGSMVESYDSLIRRAVPQYNEMIARLLDYLPERAGNILELGCGTGNLSLMLARKFPDARFSFVDGSAEMLGVTRSRLDPRGASLLHEPVFLESRFEELELPDGSFDLIVSSISLHHVVDKAALYRLAHAALGDGGHLCFADQLRGEPEANHDVNWERWLEFCRAPGNCTPDEIQSLLDHAAAHDHYTSLVDHEQLLLRAGFTAIDCVWRNGMWGIVTASSGR
jgi:tRNA (cmo5U34)-methyltransferase